MFKVRRPVGVALLPPRAVTRQNRKIGLLGSYPDAMRTIPWDDPSWELWGHACSRNFFARKLDRYFDLHPKASWTRKNKRDKGYLEWLQCNLQPIYMQERHPEVPASIKFPRKRILEEFGTPRPYFTSQVAWMIALIFTEPNVSAIGLWGVNYSASSEYAMQRGGAEYWLGRAVERGLKVVIPENCSLLGEPKGQYGYDSHDEETGELFGEYKKLHERYRVPFAAVKQEAIPAPELAKRIADEEEEFKRPSWALRKETCESK